MRLIVVLLLFLPHLNHSVAGEVNNENKPVKNVIIILADGMGLSHYSEDIYQSTDQSILEMFPFTGLHRPVLKGVTHPDLAMSATALACGVVSRPGYIGLDKDSVAHQSLFDLAKAKGKATGLVSNGSLFFSENAAFYAHTGINSIEEVGLNDYANAGIDLFIGTAEDQYGTVSQFKGKEFDLKKIKSGADFDAIEMTKEKSLLLLAEAGYQESEGFLSGGILFAASYLEKQNRSGGFVLVVNTTSILDAVDKQDVNALEKALFNYEAALQAGLSFAIKNKETLVLTTSGFEKGGHAINPGSKRDSLLVQFSTSESTDAMVPVFAQGPGANLFSGVYEYTDIFDKISMLLELGEE